MTEHPALELPVLVVKHVLPEQVAAALVEKNGVAEGEKTFLCSPEQQAEIVEKTLEYMAVAAGVEPQVGIALTWLVEHFEEDPREQYEVGVAVCQ